MCLALGSLIFGPSREFRPQRRPIGRRGRSPPTPKVASFRHENSDIEFYDHSVRDPYDSDRADYIKDRIPERLNRASVCVIYLSESTAQSKWVKWEVDEAVRLGKKVVAVQPNEGAPSNAPDWIRQHGISVVEWSDLPKHLK